MEYFYINRNSVDNPLVVWEAHKPVVRGVLIRIGSRLKREHTRQTDELLSRLHSLECSHKASLARSTYQDLLTVREELRTLLFHKTKQKLAWAQRAMYEFLNKPGTLLVRALCGP